MRTRGPEVELAIKAAGGPTALARALGIQMTSIYCWRQIPAARVIAVERATGISRHELRPDLYPPLEPAEAA